MQELRELLPQKRIRKVRQLDDRRFLFSLHRPCPFDLAVVLEQRLPCLYLQPKESRAGSPVASASDWLLSMRSHLAGGTIVAVEKELGDRAVTLAIEEGKWPSSARTLHLRLELIPLRVNAFLRDDQGRILRAFRPHQPGAGPAAGSGLESLDRQVLHDLVLDACRESGRKGPRTGRTVRPRTGTRGLSPLFLREIAHRCPPPDPEGAWECFREMIRRLRHGPVAPRIYPPAQDNRPWICTPFPLAHLEGCPHREFPDMNAAVAETCRLFQDRQGWLQGRQARLSGLRRRGRKLARLLNDLETDLEKNRQAHCFKKYSDLLLAQASGLPAGRTSVHLSDLFQPDQSEVAIPLEPRLTALQNATRYARLFRKSSRAIPRILTRLEAVRAELSALEEQREQLDRTLSGRAGGARATGSNPFAGAARGRAAPLFRGRGKAGTVEAGSPLCFIGRVDHSGRQGESAKRRLDRQSGSRPRLLAACGGLFGISRGSAKSRQALGAPAGLAAGSGPVGRLLQPGPQRAPGRSALHAEEVRHQAQRRKARCRPPPALPVRRRPSLHPRLS